MWCSKNEPLCAIIIAVKLNKLEKMSLSVLLLVSVFVRLVVVLVLEVEPSADSVNYMHMAECVAVGEVMDDGYGNVAFFSAGYPLLLGLFFKLFGVSVEVGQYVNVVLGVCGVWLVYLCAKVIFSDWRWGIAAGALWSVYPPGLIYVEYIAKENLMIVLLMLQVYLLLKFGKSLSPRKMSFVIGIVFGVQLLVGSAVVLTGAIVVFVISGFVFSLGFWKKMRWGNVGLFGVGLVLTLLPWLGYTYDKLGVAVLNTNGGFNVYIGNNANSDVEFMSIADTPMGAEFHELRAELGEVGINTYLKAEAITHISDHRLDTALLFGRKLINFWRLPLHGDNSGEQSNFEWLMRKCWLVNYVLIVLLGVLPLWYFGRLGRDYWVLYLTVGLYCLVHGVAYVMFRYRLPIMPVMCILCVGGVKFVYEAWCCRRLAIK